jgi:hypothetical protein
LERWKLQLPFKVLLLPDSRGQEQESHINLATMEEGGKVEARHENQWWRHIRLFFFLLDERQVVERE